VSPVGFICFGVVVIENYVACEDSGGHAGRVLISNWLFSLSSL